ncbi:NUDIX hydrolase [Kitasatospora sp. YST-16]|uniref:NUDIX domain-containing protein n=1 Tax=Kitasatospora sp. YST-16 TaxID=2998080 RepID=UPI0022836A35|nr:NUDIX hydrolase [Kitasatospora sp. YST-16]WAL74832.1 NUDIX hydrolase [Kitasatospora sp. YST-16]WNW40887.1 NUDIX hydrolase [Streptomyces sp. Li-HN-5-13]
MGTAAPTPDDPEAWTAYLAEGNARQARKRVAVDLLIRDTRGRVLVVNPAYKPDWDLPGGMSEANEAPDDTARRELREELGLDIVPCGLLVVEWVPPHGPWDDQLAFILDGGTIPDAEMYSLRPHDAELTEVAMVSSHKAERLLRARLVPRFRAAMRALENERPCLMRDGQLLG